MQFSNRTDWQKPVVRKTLMLRPRKYSRKWGAAAALDLLIASNCWQPEWSVIQCSVNLAARDQSESHVLLDDSIVRLNDFRGVAEHSNPFSRQLLSLQMDLLGIYKRGGRVCRPNDSHCWAKQARWDIIIIV